MITKEMLRNDSQDMFGIIRDFPNQVKSAIEIGKQAPMYPKELKSNNVFVFGMGGSAISGDILKSLLYATTGANHLNINVTRNYNAPASITPDSYVIVSSYSGNTEETISAFKQVLEKTKNIVCITTGGELLEIAKAHNIQVMKIPAGFQPRAALGYSFFPMLYLLFKNNAFQLEAIDSIIYGLNEVFDLLDCRSKQYSDISDENNPAVIIAEKLHNKIPVIYSSSERLDSVNLRWRCQIQENAKQLAFGNLLPEMNHNEINSWSYPADLLKRFVLLFLKDSEDHERVKIRFDALEKILSNSIEDIIAIESPAKSLLARIFDLIYLGDWVSFYMAIYNNIDPTPIPLINELKGVLSKK